MLSTTFCLLVFCFFVSGSLAGNDEVLSEEFCRQFPSLHLCRLHDTLQGSLVELQYLLQDTEGMNGAAANGLQKRKSAFVRFGKRAAEESAEQEHPAPSGENSESPNMEKRKSAFVRFGRSIGEADKRKSQYIRFGRK